MMWLMQGPRAKTMRGGEREKRERRERERESERESVCPTNK